jgi:hypothetical protein
MGLGDDWDIRSEVNLMQNRTISAYTSMSSASCLFKEDPSYQQVSALGLDLQRQELKDEAKVIQKM